MFNPCVDACKKVFERDYNEECAKNCVYADLMRENEFLKRELKNTKEDLKWAMSHLNTDV